MKFRWPPVGKAAVYVTEAVAVFDKTSEINDYMRLVRHYFGNVWETPEQWLERMGRLSRWAYELAEDAFNEKQLAMPVDVNVEAVLSLILPAFPFIWTHEDSKEPPTLKLDPVVAAEFTSPYLPRLDTLIIRQVGTSGRPGEPLAVQWINHLGRSITPPAAELPLPEGYVVSDGVGEPV